jgi:hypothetical protein
MILCWQSHSFNFNTSVAAARGGIRICSSVFSSCSLITVGSYCGHNIILLCYINTIFLNSICLLFQSITLTLSQSYFYFTRMHSILK